MKIQALLLKAIGPFTDEELDFASEDAGFHLVLGHNEAGKSSALRALHYLFWGFPMRLDDDFVHAYRHLRVGGVIRGEHGQSLTFFRRKAATKSLRDQHDQDAIDEAELKRFLGPVDENLFRSAFGIDHSTLVQGGRELAKGRGELGAALFSGSGAANLHAVRRRLENECEALFLPRGSNPRINALLHELENTRIQMREQQLLPKQWETYQEEFEQARNHRQQQERLLQERRREKSRLERALAALSLISRRDDLMGQHRAVREAPLLPDDFAQRRNHLEMALQEANIDLRHATETLQRDQRKLETLHRSPHLLEHQASIERLFKDLGVYEQCQQDRPALAAELKACEKGAQACLRRLGLKPSTLEPPVCSSAQRIRIRELASDHQALSDAVQRMGEAVEELRGQIRDAQHSIQQLPAPQSAEELEAVLAETLAGGDLEAQEHDLRQQYESAAQQAEIDLRRLGLWSGPLCELEQLPVPSVETIERCQRELEELAGERRQAERDLAAQTDALEELARQIEQLQLIHDLPSEQGLREIRRRREELWRLIQSAWLAEDRSPDDWRHALPEVSSERELAERYIEIVRQSDQVSDRLRREAERVATHAQLVSQRNECQSRIESLKQQRQRVASSLEEAERNWRRLWEPAGVEAQSPREMLAWLRRHRELAAQAKAVRQLQRQWHKAADQAAGRRELFGRQLEALGQACERAAASLSQRIERAKRTVERIRRQQSQRENLQEQLAALESQQSRAEARLQETVEAQEHWKAQWADALQGLPLRDTATPAQAMRVLEIMDELNGQWEQAERIREQRLQRIDDASQRYLQDVKQLARELGEAGQRVEHLVSKFHQRLAVALRAEEEQRILAESIDATQKKLSQIKARVEKHQQHLCLLCEQAGCETSEQLPEAEQRSRRRQEIEAKLAEVDDRLRELSMGLPLDEFIDQVRQEGDDSLPDRVEQLVREIESLDETIKNELGPEEGRKQQRCLQLDSSAGAAEAAEHAADLIAAIAAEAEEFARARLALRVFQRGIERYRQRHQGPVVRRAAELFHRLTCGSFSDLRIDYNADGQPELLGVRGADQTAVPISGMSDGTADQLYLSFRLAWLESYLQAHPPIPLIIDDILIRFDDQRSLETLRVLAELSKQTQVIFFTHHQHLAQIAAAELPEEDLLIHRLAPARAAASWALSENHKTGRAAAP